MNPPPTENPAGVPPVLPPAPARKSASLRQPLSVLLSVCLGLFLADAALSLADDSLILFFGAHVLTSLRMTTGLVALLFAALTYLLMALTPMVPKRIFLPVALFAPAAMLLTIPLVIFFHNQMQLLICCLSLAQVVCGVGVLRLAQGRFTLRWPLVPAEKLGARGFSWRNLFGFVAANVFVLVPAAVMYLVFCAAWSLDHFTEGFAKIRPAGFVVQERTYVRNDGKTIQLFPMAHVGDAGFYRQISRAFPTNSIVLLEGVTDEHHLLTNQLSYKRMARKLGLSEQHEAFEPARGKLVRADVDISEFTTNTIGMLNLVTLLHTQGLTAQNLSLLLNFPDSPQLEAELFGDLLGKRNRHLLAELKARLPETDHIIIPWGAAHMPGISAAIQQEGFRLDSTQRYVVIHFGSTGNNDRGSGTKKEAEKPK